MVDDVSRELAGWADRYVKTAPRKAAKAAADRAASEVDSTRATSVAIFAALDRAERCRRCGRRLRDPVSVERRIGPECIKDEHAAFAREFVERPSGEVFVERGVGRVRSAGPVKGHAHLVEVVIAVEGREAPVTAHADARFEPFRTLFARGRGQFALDHHRVDVAYWYEIRRVDGANKFVRLAELPRALKRRVLVDLRPAVTALGGPDPDVRRAG